MVSRNEQKIPDGICVFPPFLCLLSDKLNELRREKQKLVEKIMDQYRVLEPSLPLPNKSKSVVIQPLLHLQSGLIQSASRLTSEPESLLKYFI